MNTATAANDNPLATRTIDMGNNETLSRGAEGAEGAPATRARRA